MYRDLTVDRLENAAVSTRVYIVRIPGEAMTESGECTFIIDGYIEGIRRRSVSDVLKVKAAPNGDEAVVPDDITPTQYEQLQAQIESIMENIQEAAVSAASAAESAQAAAGSVASVASNATIAATAATEAKAAADSAKQVAGGDFVTPAELNAHANDKSNPHGVTAKQVGALAKAGDTMTGKLRVSYNGPTVLFADTANDTNSTVMHTNHLTDIGVFNSSESTDNARYIRLRDSQSYASLKGAVQIVDRTNAVSKAYNLYGEHNKPTMEDLNGIGSIATYYSAASAMSADDLTESLALIPVSATVNEELYRAVGGTFAYVITLFYIDKTTTSRRAQIALSYNSVPQKMAVRSYGANGWVGWRSVAFDAPVITAGTTDLTAGVSSLATGTIHLVYE